MFNSKLGTLSGGELRRLYLLDILMKSPNLLILDEPTNDLDIVTLNVLEEYLSDFKGTLIIVSHDRHFLDRLADHLFIFCGDGVIKDFVGTYSEYREFIREYGKTGKQPEKAKGDSASKKEWKENKEKKREKDRLSYKEQRELEKLEKEIEALTAEKKEIEEKLSSNSYGYEEITRMSERISGIISELETKEERWLELSC
jgi:ATP-binding cassette subfamily F protein uup